MPQKIYRYRPLNDLLYKELLYRELYFAEFSELNDPADLNTFINFYTEDKEQVSWLFEFLFSRTLFSLIMKQNLAEIQEFNRLGIRENVSDLYEEFYNKILEYGEINNGIVLLPSLIKIIAEVEEENGIKIKFDKEVINNEIVRLTNKFFNSSYVLCFSKSYSNYLLWSHYSSKHCGICLEFSVRGLLENDIKFPFEFHLNNKSTKSKVIVEDRLQKVKYTDTLPYINFYDFLPVFANEYDVDLMNLTKGRWHPFAEEVKNLYTHKFSSWSYEEEWRSIHVNFNENINAEDRIQYYPAQSLSGIYFGLRTPDIVKLRIYELLKRRNRTVKFYQAVSKGSTLEFDLWEPEDSKL